MVLMNVFIDNVIPVGKTTNHAVVMASVITQGKSVGVHPLLVQTRSMENHEPLPGLLPRGLVSERFIPTASFL
jgi:hypothetical protein